MRLTFKQGIVRHQTDTGGTPTFLDVAGGFVSVIVSPDPTIVTFIHGPDTSYLYTESVTQTNAWGPFTPGSEYWLYWQINPTTGVREFGYTEYEPVESPTAPSTPAVGQMWYDTVRKMWFEFTGSLWGEVIRVFACKLDVGLVPRSMSDSTPDFKGTQVGENVTHRVGALAFDGAGEPIKKKNRKFFTTEEIFTTGVPYGASLRVNNILIPGQAQINVAAHQVVEYIEYNQIAPASPFTQGEKVYGILEEDAVTNETVNFVTEGVIFDNTWDWETGGADVNDPIYIDATGQLVLTPVIPEQLPVGAVIGPQKILFAPRLFPQVTASGGGSGADTFLELTDTPSSYSGSQGLFTRVNGAGTALEFIDVADTFLELPDTPGSYAGQTGLAVVVNGGETGLQFSAFAGNFLELTDTPASYAGQQYLFPRVNVTENALEFIAVTDTDTFVALTDTPASYAGQTGQYFRVNVAEDGVEFATPPTATAQNVGITGVGIFRDKVGNELNFKKLIEGSNVTITAGADTITIDSLDSFLDLSDTPTDYTGQTGKVPAVNALETELEFIDPVCSCDFLDLPDTPSSYVGQAGTYPQVNSYENALEFVTITPGATNFLQLSDAPLSYASHKYESVRVNGGEGGLEYVCPTHPYDIIVNITDTPSDNAIIFRMRVARDFTLNASDHRAFAETVDASNSLELTVKRYPDGGVTSGSPNDGIDLGTITFPANVAWAGGTLTQTSFDLGDLLTVEIGAINGWADFTLSLNATATDDCLGSGGS